MVKVTLIDGETNVSYEICVTPEQSLCAQNDTAYATQLLQEAQRNLAQPGTSIRTVSNTSTSTESPASEANKKDGTFTWSEGEVLLLLAAYRKKQHLFIDEKIPKSKAWQEVLEDITLVRKEKGLQLIPMKKCITKMEALKRHYKYVKDSNKKSGNNRVTWKFYEEMDSIFSEQPWVKPLAVAGSNVEENNNNLAFETTSSTKRRRSKQCFIEDIIIDRRKREKRRIEEHAEKMTLLRTLTGVLKQLVGENAEVEVNNSAPENQSMQNDTCFNEEDFLDTDDENEYGLS